MRILAQDIRRQEVIMRDNVPVAIDGVLFFKVVEVQSAVMRIQDYRWAVTCLAQTALRDVVGGVTLDELLAERETASASWSRKSSRNRPRNGAWK